MSEESTVDEYSLYDDDLGVEQSDHHQATNTADSRLPPAVMGRGEEDPPLHDESQPRHGEIASDDVARGESTRAEAGLGGEPGDYGKQGSEEVRGGNVITARFWDFDFSADARFQQFYQEVLSTLASSRAAQPEGEGPCQQSAATEPFRCRCEPLCCSSASEHHVLLRHKALWYRDQVDAAIDIHQVLRDWSNLHAAARLNRLDRA